jgi:cyclic pyranopterin phosphate synthase
MRPTADTFGRPLASLRLSVTDRCNLRCRYCMPEEEYTWLPRATLLTFEELTRLVGIFAGAGVRRVRLTGGEPLLRHDIVSLVRMLAGVRQVDDLAMTTNGVLLAEHAVALREAGLQRVTVSLDTLRRDRFQALTRRDLHWRVLDGIAAARAAGFPGLKIDTVVLRGRNEDELADLIEFGKANDAEVRFIEYMDVGGATHWSIDDVVTRAEILGGITGRYGAVEPVGVRGAAPAERFALPDGTTFGVIASTTAPFCAACDRSRLTADGMWLLCLYAQAGADLRKPLREGASDEEIAAIVRRGWEARTDRGAEERASLGHREALVGLERLRRDPHLEMHTRGG